MKTTVYSARPWDRQYFNAAFGDTEHTVHFIDARLTHETVPAAEGSDAICCFVNDELNAASIQTLTDAGVRLLLLRCAGFNNVDLTAARDSGLTVMRVPEYSPHAVAEHTVALLLTLNRRIHRAWTRVREGDFRLDGLLGFDLHGKTAGIIGTGKVGACVAQILMGFGMQVIAFDPNPNDALVAAGVRYTDLDEVFRTSRVISLHCPLNAATKYLINQESLALTQPGVVLLNTGRGALVDTYALIQSLKTQHVAAVGLDVYEEEASLFFEDHSHFAIDDDVFARLLTFPNVLITGHQGFFTHEALTAIAEITLQNLQRFAAGDPSPETTVTI